eukprot:COSAG06_NODE_5105_length_3716_cov_2.563450_8_plen_65_part_00
MAASALPSPLAAPAQPGAPELSPPPAAASATLQPPMPQESSSTAAEEEEEQDAGRTQAALDSLV